MLSRLVLPCVLALTAALFAGCSGGEETEPSTCVEGLDLECQPLYAPTFDEIFSRTLQPTCAQGGSACHAPGGGQGGLSFESVDQAYTLLTEGDGGEAWVKAGDAACSPLLARLESDDASKVMPPGGKLPEAERCAVVQWIAAGAKR